MSLGSPHPLDGAVGLRQLPFLVHRHAREAVVGRVAQDDQHRRFLLHPCAGQGAEPLAPQVGDDALQRLGQVGPGAAARVEDVDVLGGQPILDAQVVLQGAVDAGHQTGLLISGPPNIWTSQRKVRNSVFLGPPYVARTWILEDLQGHRQFNNGTVYRQVRPS